MKSIIDFFKTNNPLRTVKKLYRERLGQLERDAHYTKKAYFLLTGRTLAFNTAWLYNNNLIKSLFPSDQRSLRSMLGSIVAKAGKLNTHLFANKTDYTKLTGAQFEDVTTEEAEVPVLTEEHVGSPSGYDAISSGGRNLLGHLKSAVMDFINKPAVPAFPVMTPWKYREESPFNNLHGIREASWPLGIVIFVSLVCEVVFWQYVLQENMDMGILITVFGYAIPKTVIYCLAVLSIYYLFKWMAKSPVKTIMQDTDPAKTKKKKRIVLMVCVIASSLIIGMSMVNFYYQDSLKASTQLALVSKQEEPLQQSLSIAIDTNEKQKIMTQLNDLKNQRIELLDSINNPPVWLYYLKMYLMSILGFTIMISSALLGGYVNVLRDKTRLEGQLKRYNDMCPSLESDYYNTLSQMTAIERCYAKLCEQLGMADYIKQCLASKKFGDTDFENKANPNNPDQHKAGQAVMTLCLIGCLMAASCGHDVTPAAEKPAKHIYLVRDLSKSIQDEDLPNSEKRIAEQKRVLTLLLNRELSGVEQADIALSFIYDNSNSITNKKTYALQQPKPISGKYNKAEMIQKEAGVEDEKRSFKNQLVTKVSRDFFSQSESAKASKILEVLPQIASQAKLHPLDSFTSYLFSDMKQESPIRNLSGNGVIDKIKINLMVDEDVNWLIKQGIGNQPFKNGRFVIIYPVDVLSVSSKTEYTFLQDYWSRLLLQLGANSVEVYNE